MERRFDKKDYGNPIVKTKYKERLYEGTTRKLWMKKKTNRLEV